MKKLILSGLMILVCAGVGLAQTTTTSDYKKSEFFVGYSNNQVDTGLNSESGNAFRDFFNDRESFHGVNVTGTYNVTRYVGITGDVSATYNNKTFTIPNVPTGPTTTGTVSFKTNNSLYNFLGGVQVKDNSSNARLKPFAYALVGAGHGRTKIKDLNCPTGADCTDLTGSSETGLAGAFGGGLDIKINDKIDFRAIKVDYNPIKFDSGTSHNIRLGVGLVF
jgi:opacity protein-like surface antigen